MTSKAPTRGESARESAPSGKLVYDGLQPCPYLPGRIARMPLYRQLRTLTLEEADTRFAGAERRVGSCLYRTACPGCQACEGIRIPVDDFRPSRSHRRVLKRWEGHGRVVHGAANYSEDRLALFNRHKRERGLTGATEDAEMSTVGYASWLVQTCVPTMEMRYYHDDELIGVGVVDLGRESISSVYFYFAPERADLSPGVFSVLQEIDLCRVTGRKWLYLGLFVQDCRHLAYKADYTPNERLIGGTWRRSI